MTDAATRTNGRVKWFNNKVGYGFISAEVNSLNVDIFVHHTAMKTADNQFRYLVEGEYVELIIIEGRSGKMAADVTGIDGKKLMCESRCAERESNHSRRGETFRREPSTKHKSNGPSHFDGRSTVHVAEDGSVWKLVSNGKVLQTHETPAGGSVKIEVDM
jgi:cold shock protein